MSRTSQDQYNDIGLLTNGYDYSKQAWVVDGKYMRCGHPESKPCPRIGNCYGRTHENRPCLTKFEDNRC